MVKEYIHYDSLGQLIELGQPIAFTSSYLKGVKIGQVSSICRARIRILYTYTYKTREGEVKKGAWSTLIMPERTIQLGTTLPQSIIWNLLKNS